MYFHVSPVDHAPGTVLQPGQQGRLYRQFRPGGPMPNGQNIASIMWEIALESARFAINPDLPSRLESVYVWENLDHATQFRNDFRQGQPIFSVVPESNLVRTHRADFGVFLGSAQLPYVDYMSVGARRYWEEEPTGMVEILVPSAIKIVDRLN